MSKKIEKVKKVLKIVKVKLVSFYVDTFKPFLVKLCKATKAFIKVMKK